MVPVGGLVEGLEGLQPGGQREALIEERRAEEQAVAGGELAQLEFLDIRFVLDVEHDGHEREQGGLGARIGDGVRVEKDGMAETVREVEKGLYHRGVEQQGCKRGLYLGGMRVFLAE